MAKKKTAKTRSDDQSKAIKSRSHSKRPEEISQVPTQTNQPFEQDVKRRIGHFAGAGEPPLMKK